MNSNPLSEVLEIKAEVKEALASGHPVLALESTIISHGMPYPMNVETALEVEKTVRSEGAIPATIAVIDGRIRVGLTESDLERVGKGESKDPVLKLSRRDLPYALAMKRTGATTVAGTLHCSGLAGISVFATGGIGGVHRLAEKTFDISADLQELAKSNITVVCAGAKSILDIGLTLEVLETLGVLVIGYQTDTFPSFYSRKSKYPLEYRMDSPQQIAHLLNCKAAVGSSGGVLVVNPVPQEYDLDSETVEKYVEEALVEASQKGIQGKGVTPFLLSRLVSKTQGESLQSNIALIKNNARLGAAVAKEVAQSRKD